jgi:hypothetical protein
MRFINSVSVALPLFFSASLARAELFVSSHETHQVMRYNETNGTLIDVFVPNNNGQLRFPHGLAFGRDGNLYVASAGNDSALRYNGQTGVFIDTFIAAGSGGLDYPVALVFRNEHLYVSSQLNDAVLRYNTTTGAFIDAFIQPSPELDGPSDMVFGPGGDLYVVGRFNSRVVQYDGVTGAFKRALVATQLSQPFGLRFVGENLLVANGNLNQIERFNLNGAYQGVFGSFGLNFPIGLAIGPEGDIYVASYAADTVVRFNGVTGEYVRHVFAPRLGGLRGPNFLTFRPPPDPGLTITLQGATVSIAWPAGWGYEDYQLFRASTVTFENQTAAPAPTVIGGNTNLVEAPIAGDTVFFRLQKP